LTTLIAIAAMMTDNCRGGPKYRLWLTGDVNSSSNVRRVRTRFHLWGKLMHLPPKDFALSSSNEELQTFFGAKVKLFPMHYGSFPVIQVGCGKSSHRLHFSVSRHHASGVGRCFLRFLTTDVCG